MTEIEPRAENVGQILVKVQGDLRQLREKFVVGNGTINVSELDKALAKTEEGLQRHTEDVVYQLHNEMQMLPLELSNEEQFLTAESTVELQKADTRQPDYADDSRYKFSRQPLPPSIKLPARKLMQLQGLTPGQKHQRQIILKAIKNPHNKRNRSAVKDRFGVQLPLINEKRSQKVLGKPITGSTVDHQTILPKANRIDASLTPPPIEEEDARKGILSLLERGLIPPAAQLTLEPSPIRHKTFHLCDPGERYKQHSASESHTSWALMKLDSNAKSEEPHSSVSQLHTILPKTSVYPETRAVSAKTRSSSAGSDIWPHRTPASVKTFEMPLQHLDRKPPPTTSVTGLYKPSGHRFAIQNGRTRDNQPDFQIFRQQYIHKWGSIVTMLQHLEKLLTLYTVPIAFIHGDRLADLAMEFELEKAPTMKEMLGVIINREDVESIINKPGRRFIGPNGTEVAAIQIQSVWRRYLQRCKYLEYRQLKWAAGVIAISWIMRIKMTRMRQKLKQTRHDQLEAFRQRAKIFASSWERIKHSRRVIIHIPSLGYIQSVRDTISDIGIRQNTQMARLCDIKDPNVDVILISAVPLSDETLQYYSKLMGICSAVANGNPDDQRDMTDRYKIIVPEAVKSFPVHRMCLSTILKYSPWSLKRIKNLIKGRDAFIVTGMPHKDDLAVSDALDVPILCPEPDVAHLFSTKSGCKRIFASANVSTSPSEYDVYSIDQLHECLAQLVTENLGVQRWLFKLDDEFNGRGIAFCDVPKFLRCYNWALKEEQRYGEKWTKKWAQEAAYIKIYAEIPDILQKYAQPVNAKLYPTWDKFLEAFVSQGGIIEACPPSENITTLTADMLIEPTGTVNLLTCGDQIHAESLFSCWGVSTPQSSIEPSVLNDACHKIGDACKARGIVGYLRIDFVTFIHPKTMVQNLWALDLSLCYSDNLAMFRLMELVTHGTFQPQTHVFKVPLPIKDTQPARRKQVEQVKEEITPNKTCYAVMSTHLMHSNLAVIHYSVFFQMCRAHGIGYDIKDRTGTAFTLIDSFSRERLGMLTIGDTLQEALATFARNLSIIHQEVSTPNMQGITNFKAAIADIDNILGTTQQNDEGNRET